MPRDALPEGPHEVALVGDLTERIAELCDKLIEIPPGGECVLWFDSPGGSPYCAMALASLLILRDVHATGVVIGECSSATVLPFAACRRRLVTPQSVLLFHHMTWQSEENVGLVEAAEWARHFAELERDSDKLLTSLLGAPPGLIDGWVRAGHYVKGSELAEAGLAELIELKPLDLWRHKGRKS